MLTAEDLEDPPEISISFLRSLQSTAENKALSDVLFFIAPIFQHLDLSDLCQLVSLSLTPAVSCLSPMGTWRHLVQF